MGRTLNIYVFRKTLLMTLYFVLGVAGIAFLIDFNELLIRIGSLPSYTLAAGLTISAMRVPFIIQVALPFMMLFATMATLMTLNRKYELVVARSVGISAWQFLMPTWAAAFVIGTFAVLLLQPAAAELYSRAVLNEAALGPSGKSASRTDRPWLRQTDGKGGAIIIGARTAVREGTTLVAPVFLFINEEGDVEKRLDAARARLADGQWVLNDVRTSRAGEPPLDERRVVVPTDLDISVVTDAFVPAEFIPFYELPGQINSARTFGVPSNPFRMQFHSLVAKPILLIAMTLIAATVSLRFVRFGQSAGMILGGITAGFVLYVVTELTKSFGGAGIIPPVLAAWLPVVAAALFGIAYLLHREDG